MAESSTVLLGSPVAMAPASPLGASGIASFEGSSVEIGAGSGEVAPNTDAAVALSAMVLLVAAGFWLLRQGRDRA